MASPSASTDACATCDSAGVPGRGTMPWDIEATTADLQARVSAGRMRELRGDVPLEDMLALLESELKYTVVTCLECLDCGRVLLWGLCIRGNPILEHVERSRVESRPWGTVPPRERWARDRRAESRAVSAGEDRMSTVDP